MKATFHYIVKAKLIRYKNPDEINFLEFEEAFENENPILARQAAFNFYQNYIDVLLEGKEKKYVSDKQTRKDLQTFINPGTWTKIKIGHKERKISDAIGNGIGIFLVIDLPVENFKANEKFLIHGIGNLLEGSDDTDFVIGNLGTEFELYQKIGYKIKDKDKEIIYCSRYEWEDGHSENEPSAYLILETPFDWTGYNKPYWWGEPEENKEEVPSIPISLEQIIEGGEGNQVEFKPTLLFNSNTKSAGIGKKAIIARAICAFLNANGGYLLIGMEDNKQVRGLSNDFSLSNGKDPKDFFLLEFDEMIEHFISTSVISNISAQFFEIENKEIFVVEVQPSNRRPIFFKGQDGKEFYVRKLASSKRIYDIEEIANYCIDRWATETI